MFFKPYRVEGRVSPAVGTAAQNIFSFSINYFNPNSFKFIISYITFLELELIMVNSTLDFKDQRFGIQLMTRLNLPPLHNSKQISKHYLSLY